MVNGEDSRSSDSQIARVRIPFGASIYSSVVECWSSKPVARVRFPVDAYVGVNAFRYDLHVLETYQINMFINAFELFVFNTVVVPQLANMLCGMFGSPPPNTYTHTCGREYLLNELHDTNLCNRCGESIENDVPSFFTRVSRKFNSSYESLKSKVT